MAARPLYRVYGTPKSDNGLGFASSINTFLRPVNCTIFVYYCIYPCFVVCFCYIQECDVCGGFLSLVYYLFYPQDVVWCSGPCSTSEVFPCSLIVRFPFHCCICLLFLSLYILVSPSCHWAFSLFLWCWIFWIFCLTFVYPCFFLVGWFLVSSSKREECACQKVWQKRDRSERKGLTEKNGRIFQYSDIQY